MSGDVFEHRLQAMKEKAQQELARLEAHTEQGETASVDSNDTPGDVGMLGDTQPSLSRVERRTQWTEVSQEEG
jgi:hypothetical protein